MKKYCFNILAALAAMLAAGCICRGGDMLKVGMSREEVAHVIEASPKCNGEMKGRLRMTYSNPQNMQHIFYCPQNINDILKADDVMSADEWEVFFILVGLRRTPICSNSKTIM